MRFLEKECDVTDMSDIDFQPDQIELHPLNASLVHYNVSPVVKGRRSKGQLKRKLAVKSKELMKKMKINCDEQSLKRRRTVIQKSEGEILQGEN